MGREAIATCHWRGNVAEVKVHIDSKHLSLRGDIRADLARANIIAIDQVPEGVAISIDGEHLTMEFNETDAKRWVTALRKTPPTLAKKLGTSTEHLAFVCGASQDNELNGALRNSTTDNISNADQIIAIVMDQSNLTDAALFAKKHPEKHLWMIYQKGKNAAIGDTAIRTYLREQGFIDSKSCAVSDLLTATRYRQAQT
jgi:hypothetical protein